MTIKNFFGGAIINYGDTLPADAGTPDGALFFKTGAAAGLYVFNFTRDSNAGVFGDQSVQGWTQIVASGGLDADTLDGLDSTAFQAADPGLTSLGGLSTNGFVVRTATDTFTTRTFTAGSGITFTPSTAGNGSANLTFSVDQSTLSLDSFNGTLSINKGGTGSSLASVTSGGIAYANSTSSLAVSAAGAVPSGTGTGTIYRVLIANGSSAPTWLNALTSLNVAYATSAGSATTATTAATATSATTAGTATNVAWTGITGLPGAVQQFTNTPASGFTTWASPAYFHRFASGGSSMTPDQFPLASISGFESTSATDMGNTQTGISVIGSSTGGTRSMQIAANWNVEEAAPSSLRFRVNDTTGTTNAWGAWQTLWDQGNLTNVSQLINDANYVTSSALNGYLLNTSDEMSGSLKVQQLVVGTAAYPGANNLAVTGTIAAGGAISSSGAIAANGGHLSTTQTVRASDGSAAAPSFSFTSDPNTGIYCETANSNTVFVATGGSQRARFWSAGLSVTGAIEASGNVTAFSTSDYRIKEDIQVIVGAVNKVKAIRGVTYTNKNNGNRETGVIAQEVLEVLPEVIRVQKGGVEDGMYGVNYGQMVGLLVQAIKEQQEQIDALKRQVNSLIR